MMTPFLLAVPHDVSRPGGRRDSGERVAHRDLDRVGLVSSGGEVREAVVVGQRSVGDTLVELIPREEKTNILLDRDELEVRELLRGLHADGLRNSLLSLDVMTNENANVRRQVNSTRNL